MEKSKLYSILESFDKYEQNKCRKYVESPYFNRSEQLVTLFNLLIKHINRKNGKSITKEDLWKKVDATREYDDVRFRKYASDLLKLVEGFIAQQVYESNPLHQASNLIKAVERRKLNKMHSSSVRTARQLSSKQQHRPASYYYDQYKIERNYFELVELDRKERINYDEINFNLDQFFFAEKLAMYCGILTRKSHTDYNYDIGFHEPILDYLANTDIEAFAPIVQVYYQVYLAYHSPENADNYHRLRALLDKYGHVFTDKEAYELYVYAQNYCAFRLNEGKVEFSNELFQLYQTMVNKGIIFEEGRLSPWDFKNIILMASRVKEYTWAENFIEKYAERLPEDFRENAVSFNLARLYFEQKQYDNVIKQLRTVEYDDITYNLTSKTMLIITYFETDEIEPLYSLLESFRTYLNRHKEIPQQRRDYFKNFIRFTKKLTKVMPRDQKAIEKFKAEVEATEGFNVKWLNEKIAELESGRT